MALDLGTFVATMKVYDSDLDSKLKGWSTIGGTVASTFGNLAASGIQAAGQMLGDFAAEAAVASDATDKFRKSLEFAGLDTSVIDALTASPEATRRPSAAWAQFSARPQGPASSRPTTGTSWPRPFPARPVPW